MIARVTSRLLLVAGVALLGWCALVVGDAWVAQWAARVALETVTLPHRPAVVEPASSSPAAARPVSAAPGAALATLSIPRVGLSAVVLQGTDNRTLRRGPGHLETSVLPGETGNDVIAGHRDSFFRPLRDVKRGDDVFLEGPAGRAHYRITWARVVGAHDVSVLAATDNDVLTLITCYPFWVLGNAPDRFVVRASRVGADRMSIHDASAARP